MPPGLHPAQWPLSLQCPLLLSLVGSTLLSSLLLLIILLLLSPPHLWGSVLWGTPPGKIPFLSARGSLLLHVKISREVRKNREEQEERKRGTALANTANKRVNSKLVDLQTTWLQVQACLDEYFGAKQVPPTIQYRIDHSEVQLTATRQGLRIQESHGASLAAQFWGDPLLTSDEQTRLRSLVKDQKDKQTLTKGGGSRGSGRNLGVWGSKVNPPGGRGVLLGGEAVCIWFIPIDCLICILRTCFKCGKEGHMQAKCPKKP